MLGRLLVRSRSCWRHDWRRLASSSSSSSPPQSVASDSRGDSARDSVDSTEQDKVLSEMEERLEVARGVQDLVRKGFQSLSPEPFVQAADSLGKLPSGSVARRYLSGFIMNGHGNLLAAKGNPSMANQLLKGAFEHAMEEATQGLGDDQYCDIVSFASDLAINYAQNGDLVDAEKLIKRALYWVKSPRVGPDQALQTATLCNLGLVEALRGNYSSALDNHERARDGDNEEDLLISISTKLNLSMSLRQEGIWDKGYDLAQQVLEDSYEVWSEAREEEDNLAAFAQANLLRAASLVNAALYKLHFAQDSSDLAIVRELALDCNSLEYVDKVPSLLLLGLTADDFETASRYFSQALQNTKATPVLVAIHENISVLHQLTNAEGVSSQHERLQVNGDGKGEDGVEEKEEEEVLVGKGSQKKKEAKVSGRHGMITDLEASSNRLKRVPLGNTGAMFWVQEHYAFINGVTLKKFIKTNPDPEFCTS